MKNKQRHKIKEIVRFILTRALTLYIVLGLLFGVVINIGKIKAGFVLSRHFKTPPPFEYLLRYDERQGPFDADKLKTLILFYKNSAAYLPHAADAYGVLGVCYYYAHDDERAIRSLSKAIKIQPDFFWYHYDLGYIYYKQKDYYRAAQAFKKALSLDPMATLEYIKESKEIYWPLLGSPDNFKKIKQRLALGYRDAYILSILSYLQRKDTTMVQALAEQASYKVFPGEEFFREVLKMLPLMDGKKTFLNQKLFLREESIFIKIL